MRNKAIEKIFAELGKMKYIINGLMKHLTEIIHGLVIDTVLDAFVNLQKCIHQT